MIADRPAELKRAQRIDEDAEIVLACKLDLAEQVRGLFAAAVAAANTKTPDGEYILAGTQSLTAPFSAAGAYGGDGVARGVPASEATVTSSAVAGSALTAANGVDVLPLAGPSSVFEPANAAAADMS